MNKDLIQIHNCKTNAHSVLSASDRHYLLLVRKQGVIRLPPECRDRFTLETQLFLAASGVPVTCVPLNGREAEYFYLLISEELLHLLPADQNTEPAIKQLFHLADSDKILCDAYSQKELCLLLHYEALLLQEQKNGASASPSLLCHLTIAFLLFTARHYFSAQTESGRKETTALHGKAAHRKLVHHVIELIDARYMDDLNLSVLSDATFTNPSYLCRIFKEVSGITITAYLNQVRIAHVKQLLVDTDDLIVDIASACGYNYMPYFNQLFKKMVGLTPTQYRRTSAT